jgi:hypothetical protein
LAAAAKSTNASIDDLVDDLNVALTVAGVAGEVVAGRDADRLKLTVTAPAGTDVALLQLAAATVDAAVTQLRFVNGQYVTDSVEHHVFIEDAVVTASAHLTAADLDIAAALGFLDVSIVDGSGTAIAGVSVALTDPTTGTPGGRVTLDELFDGLDSNLASITAAPQISGSANFVLPVRADPNMFGASHPANPALVVTWTDITNPATLSATPNADMQQLLDFRDLNFVDIVQALEATIEYLATLEQFSFLNQKLPLVNASVIELVDYADVFAERLEELRNDPASSLQFVEQAIEWRSGSILPRWPVRFVRSTSIWRRLRPRRAACPSSMVSRTCSTWPALHSSRSTPARTWRSIWASNWPIRSTRERFCMTPRAWCSRPRVARRT